MVGLIIDLRNDFTLLCHKQTMKMDTILLSKNFLAVVFPNLKYPKVIIIQVGSIWKCAPALSSDIVGKQYLKPIH